MNGVITHGLFLDAIKAVVVASGPEAKIIEKVVSAQIVARPCLAISLQQNANCMLDYALDIRAWWKATQA